MTPEEDNERTGGSFWAALAARALHPAQVEIIEALRWIDQPLSAADLLKICEGQRVQLRIEHRLRELKRLGAVIPDSNGKAHGSTGHIRYRLDEPPGA